MREHRRRVRSLQLPKRRREKALKIVERLPLRVRAPIAHLVRQPRAQSILRHHSRAHRRRQSAIARPSPVFPPSNLLKIKPRARSPEIPRPRRPRALARTTTARASSESLVATLAPSRAPAPSPSATPRVHTSRRLVVNRIRSSARASARARRMPARVVARVVARVAVVARSTPRSLVAPTARIGVRSSRSRGGTSRRADRVTRRRRG